MELQRNRWNGTETSLLVSLVKQHGVAKGSELASQKLGRTAHACEQRFYYNRSTQNKQLESKEIKPAHLNVFGFNILNVDMDLTNRKIVLSF